MILSSGLLELGEVHPRHTNALQAKRKKATEAEIEGKVFAGSSSPFQEQNQHIIGKTNEVQIKPGIYLIVIYQCRFLSFDIGTLVR